MFKKRDNIKEVEEGKYLEPKFDENGLIPVVTTDFKTGDILMHGFMNDEALKKTIETKEAHYWSRSRKKIWRKGQISGFVQAIKEIRVIETILPKQFSEEETKKVCKEVIKSLGASSIKDMGKIMGSLKQKYADVIDFSRVNIIVKGLLNQ